MDFVGGVVGLIGVFFAHLLWMIRMWSGGSLQLGIKSQGVTKVMFILLLAMSC